jgi:transcriptional regulator with XRE-family HTH domain
MRSTWAPEYRSMLARLRQAREEAGLTQSEVGRRLGLRQAFISKLESGERRLDPVELARFATVYGKPVAWFLQAGSSTQ